MRLSFLACWGFVLLAGCTGRPEDEKPPAGPGRFAHSAIYKTNAPWDGPAVSLILSEKPSPTKSPVAPFVGVRIYRGISDLSGQTVRLDPKDSRTGTWSWIPRPGVVELLSWVKVHFEEIKEGQPVKGTYEIAFPDGKRERGRFEAEWWPSEGRGG